MARIIIYHKEIELATGLKLTILENLEVIRAIAELISPRGKYPLYRKEYDVIAESLFGTKVFFKVGLLVLGNEYKLTVDEFGVIGTWLE